MPARAIGGFLLRRAVLLVPLLVAVSFLCFMLVRLGGQDPVAMLAGPTATAAELEMVRRNLALDQPVWAQFLVWLGKVLSGDLGRSWISNRPVLTELLDRAPATLELLLYGVGLGALVGIPVGLKAAQKPDGAFDQVSRFLSLLGFSTPTYWLALMALFVFFYLLAWAPPGMGRISLMVDPPPRITGSYLWDAMLGGQWEAARSAAAQLVLPVLCIAIISAAPIVKQTRAIALEVLASDYIRYARAQGLPAGEVRRMVLRNSMVPVVTFVGTELAGLVGTTALIEYVFAWGGIGQFGLNAIIQGDFAVVQGYVLLLALFSVLVFLVVDVLVMLLEPRAVRA
ncbi:ABC transporter permease [Falsiroseomonas oryziterrae]|uniref:ABC transporter permease n=1 Tax=Falsiroseomonas oryziterrae TaxID=2911368 RepID=UPI001F28B410|nr:ABC transporter permease [Roseomonas sp. NPKOSM-4]